MDEGLGFHQDGTVRKAGGVNGFSGPSEGGLRAAAYMRSSLGPSMYGDTFFRGPGFDPLTGEYDPTRGGCRSDSRTRDFSNFDPLRMAQDRALSWGLGCLNSSGEALFSGLVDGGRPRLNFTIDWDGHFRGEGGRASAFLRQPIHDDFYADRGAEHGHFRGVNQTARIAGSATSAWGSAGSPTPQRKIPATG